MRAGLVPFAPLDDGALERPGDRPRGGPRHRGADALLRPPRRGAGAARRGGRAVAAGGDRQRPRPPEHRGRRLGLPVLPQRAAGGPRRRARRRDHHGCCAGRSRRSRSCSASPTAGPSPRSSPSATRPGRSRSCAASRSRSSPPSTASRAVRSRPEAPRPAPTGLGERRRPAVGFTPAPAVGAPCPRSSGDRASASGAVCGRSNRPEGARRRRACRRTRRQALTRSGDIASGSSSQTVASCSAELRSAALAPSGSSVERLGDLVDRRAVLGGERREGVEVEAVELRRVLAEDLAQLGLAAAVEHLAAGAHG